MRNETLAQLDDLDQLRSDLAEVDEEITRLLRRRRNISRGISMEKSRLGMPQTDLARELGLRRTYVERLHSHRGRELADLIRAYSEAPNNS